MPHISVCESQNAATLSISHVCKLNIEHITNTSSVVIHILCRYEKLSKATLSFRVELNLSRTVFIVMSYI